VIPGQANKKERLWAVQTEAKPIQMVQRCNILVNKSSIYVTAPTKQHLVCFASSPRVLVKLLGYVSTRHSHQ
jgi:hypothetical protein